MFSLLISVIYISLFPVAALCQVVVLSLIFMYVLFKVLKKMFGKVPEF